MLKIVLIISSGRGNWNDYYMLTGEIQAVTLIQNGENMHWLDGFGGGWMMIVWWLFLIVATVAVVKWIISRSSASQQQTEKTALDILEKRYARGEIDKEEFEEKKRDLNR